MKSGKLFNLPIIIYSVLQEQIQSVQSLIFHRYCFVMRVAFITGCMFAVGREKLFNHKLPLSQGVCVWGGGGTKQTERTNCSVVCGHSLVTLSLKIYQTLKWLSSLPILMHESFWW